MVVANVVGEAFETARLDASTLSVPTSGLRFTDAVAVAVFCGHETGTKRPARLKRERLKRAPLSAPAEGLFKATKAAWWSGQCS